ncbi:unnamed protein product [Rotaria sordida]|uniref:Uncharacterized protein n=1 Tax=Rotaria sordida TaxID=392033 RepID=A0A814URY4_9BILA|nr:unnamed protein product [Rotaria sordida]
MAKLYQKLQNSLTSYENRPKTIITEQIFGESVYIFRGQHKEIPAWYYVLVPLSKVADAEALKSDKSINVTDFGRVIEYLNNRGNIKQMFGLGIDPPKMFQTWIIEHYDSASIDENISLIYEKDDIRLCTMQRAIPQQKLGIFLRYHRKERFHYIEFYGDWKSSLAYRAGIKNFDRIIALNDVNIEKDTPNQLDRRFKTDRHLPVQMLVCSPATYFHYRSNEKLLHSDLPTVQHLKPIYATSTSNSNTDTHGISVGNESFCAVQWENSNIISTVPQSAIFKSPEFTNVNDVCFIEINGQYRKGQIIFKGSRSDCEKLKTHSVSSVISNVFNTLSNLFIRKIPNVLDSTTNSNLDFAYDKSISSLDKLKTDTIQVQITIPDANNDTQVRQNADAIQYIEDSVCTTLEELPNELFFYLFTFINIEHLYNAFWGLNSRLNNIFLTYQNLSLIFEENDKFRILATK